MRENKIGEKIFLFVKFIYRNEKIDKTIFFFFFTNQLLIKLFICAHG